MASAPPKTADRSPSLEQMLREVRRRIRSYVAVEGLALVVATACLGFWVTFALDWLFEPASRVRQGFVVALALVVVVAVYRMILRRFFARFADRNVAILLERRFRNLDDALLTAIDDSDRKAKHKGKGGAAPSAALSTPAQAMLEATRLEARRKLADARLGELFDPRPRTRAVVAALGLLLSIASFALAVPKTFHLGIDRLAGRTDMLYPRNTRLTIDGFENGEIVVPRGADLDLVVRADTTMEVPGVVYLYYESDDGSVEEELIMDREGLAKPGIDPYQQYKTPLRGIASTLDLDIRGGDARLRDLKIRVVERPQITMRLRCKFPPYMNRADDLPIAVTGIMPLPQGTLVTVEAEANKPLRRAVVERLADSGADAKAGTISETLDLMHDGKPQSEFRFELGRLDADQVVTIRLFDADGIDDAAKLALQVVADAPPAFKDLARNGVDTSVTARARLPFTGKINDDYGLSRLWFDYAFDGSEQLQVPTIVSAGGAREVLLDEALDLRDITPGGTSTPLAPGRTITIGLKAQDNRKLPDQPAGNVAGGDSFTFTIVSDADLLRLLEGREIMYREQFKALIEKVTRDRDSLVDVGKAQPAASAEKVDKDEESQPRNRDKIIVDQARSHTQENRSETLVVSTGFAGIVAELVNNRVPDSDNLRDRLAADISAPLARIGTERFPDYYAKLTALQLAVDRTTKDPAVIEAARREALRAADGILVEMNVVLNKMLELESFKEAVDLLRSIIALQKDIGDRTKAERKSKVRLLGD
ncbi:MAG: hypothetical protein K8U03_04685 [Planctomycetia bacterium]|nr:hypothetical protein [Planctomycetia bacterium]